MSNVLVLNQYALPLSQGGGTRHAELFALLEGWRPTIIVGDVNTYTQKPYHSDDPNIITVTVPKVRKGAPQQRLKSWLAYSWRAWRAAGRAPRPDIVYASTPHLLTPLLGFALAKRFGVPYICEVRDLWPESILAAGLLTRRHPSYWALRALEQLVVKKADHVVAVTAGWEEYFGKMGVPASRLTVIPNGSDADAFTISAEARIQTRRDLDLKRVTAVFAGAHGPKDGIPAILQTAREVPDVDFLLIGDGSFKSTAIRMAQREALRNVRFLDPVPKVDLPRILGACDIGIHSVTALPVFNMGMSPNKLFDYLAAALPIASNAGAPISTLVFACSGVLVGGAESLTRHVRQLAGESQDDRVRRGLSGRALLVDHYSRKESARRLEGLLDSVARRTSDARNTESAPPPPSIEPDSSSIPQ